LLDAFGALKDRTLARTLSHSDPDVRENALQIAETHLVKSPQVFNAVLALAADPNPRVRMQCALTLGELHNDCLITPLADIASKDSDDTWTRLAILSSSTGREAKLLDNLLSKDTSNSSGALSLLYELGRLTSLTASNGAVKWPAPSGSPKLLSAGAGMAEGLRSRGPVAPDFVRRIEPLISTAETTARDPKANPTLRQHAVSLLAFGEYGRVRDVLLDLLRANEPTPLQLAAVRSLTRFSAQGVVADLTSTQRWHFYTPAVRDAVLNALLSDAKHLPQMLDALESGAIPKSAVDGTRRRQLLNHKDFAIRARVESLFKNAETSDRTKVYEEWKSVLSLVPVPANGRAVFKQHCGACHRLDREGANVGPDLFGIRNQPKETILLHIIIPEHEIAPGFAAYEVQTTDGRTLTGLIVADTPSAITIRGGQGQEDTIARANIASLNSEGLSLMPQEIEKNMSRQDMADLLAFLKGEQDRPR